MESAFDNGPLGVQVQYSTDQGTTWTRLGDETTGTNWYERGPSATSLYSGIFTDATGFNGAYPNEATSHDVSTLAGNSDVRFRFVFAVTDDFGGTFNLDGFMIDDFEISATASNNALSAGVETAVSSASKNLGPSATADFYSQNGKLIARIENLSTHDYGATTVAIDNAGTGTMNFGSNTEAARQICEKTVLVTPTTNNASGNYKITLYFSETEISNWETATSQVRGNFNLFKTTGAVTAAIIGTQGIFPATGTHNGSNFTINSTFSTGFSGFGGGLDGDGGPLPVELVSFEGEREKEKVNLFWQTASEVNSDRFEILRSVSDIDNFIKIGEVGSVGNSSQLVDYTYEDNSKVVRTNDVLYYQLRQIDIDGKEDYSEIIVLKPLGEEEIITIYPTIVNDNSVTILTTYEKPIHYSIVNSAGVMVLNGSTEGTNSTVQLEKLNQGIYYVIFMDGKEKIGVRKLVKK